MDAMVLGEDSFLRNATRTEFQRSGTYHVLVVSGMNLSILAFAIFWMLRQFRLDPALAAITTVVVSFAYAFVVGVGAPVWRAALMLAIYLGARLLYRERNMLNAIGAAALGVLIADPHALFGASFQLTFLAVFIIAAIGAPILEQTTLPYARGLRLLRVASYDLQVAPQVAQFRLDLRIDRGEAREISRQPSRPGVTGDFHADHYRACGTDVHVGAHAGRTRSADGLPLSPRNHHGNGGEPGGDSADGSADADRCRRGRTGICFYNPRQAGGLGFEFGAGGNCGNGALAGRCARGGSARGHADTPRDPDCAGHAGVGNDRGAASARDRFRRGGGFGLRGRLDCFCSVTATPSGRGYGDDDHRRRTRRFHSAGDARRAAFCWWTLEGCRCGCTPILIIGEQVVSSYLWNRGIDHIDTVVISHPHADHLGGMPAVIANFHPRELWISIDHPEGELAPVVAQAQKAGMKISVKKEGDEFDYGGAHFRVLAPGRDQDTGAMRPNDDCLVFTASVGKTAALLEGDAEPVAERRIAAEHPEAMLLKVAHHGSARATSADLLAAVRPQYAVISVGARNVYGHPRREVLARLQQAGVKTYRTDEEGAVSFYLDGTSVTPEVALIQ